MLIHVDYSQYRHRSVAIVFMHCGTMETRILCCYYSSVHCFSNSKIGAHEFTIDILLIIVFLLSFVCQK